MIKNTWIYNLIFLILAITLFAYNSPRNNLLFKNGGQYVFYTNKNGSDADFVFAKCNPLLVKKNLDNYTGECVKLRFDGEFLREILSEYNAKIVKVEKIDGVESVYYYTKKIPFYQLIGGLKVNLHVAIDKDTLYIASPLIYSGY